MRLKKIIKNLSLFLNSILIFAISLNAKEEDVELRIDFTSGSVIANQPPKISQKIPDITVAIGTGDSLICDLNDVFIDAESGSALTFSAKVMDPSLLGVSIDKKDSTASLKFWKGAKGRTSVIFSASDGIKEVHDTVKVIVKDPFVLRAILTDTIVKSGYSILILNRDISHLFPLSGFYRYEVTSSDPALVKVEKSNIGRSIKMSIADSSFGSADIELTVYDNDLLSVKQTFTVEVHKSYSKTYKREQVNVNPGISLYTGIEYSGAFFKLWIKDVFGIALGGYYHWDLEGKGLEGQLLVKPSLNFPLNPYLMVSGGYHRIKEEDLDDGLNIKTENDLSIPVFRTAGGLEAWLGKSKLHVIGFEGGYSFGRKEYSSVSLSQIGSSTITEKKVTYKMPPLHLRISYSVFFRKL